MYEEQIGRGMAWLDANRPGWAERIDLDALDLSSCTVCVLGQLGSYWEVISAACGVTILLKPSGTPFDYCGKAEIIGAWSRLHGFSLGSAGIYGDLTTEWRTAIQLRRDEALPDPAEAPWWADGPREPVGQ